MPISSTANCRGKFRTIILVIAVVAASAVIAGCGGNPFSSEKPPPPGTNAGPAAVARGQQPTAPAPTPSTAAAPTQPETKNWAPFPLGQRVQGIEVHVMDARIEVLPSGAGEESEAPASALILRVRIDNKALAKEVAFEGWHRQPAPPKATLTDDRQKSYQMIPYPGPLMAGDPKIKPEGKTMHDLVFEGPDASAKTVYLELPGQRLGLSEPFRFEIPLAQVKRPADGAGGKPAATAPADKDKNEEAAANKLKLAKRLNDSNDPQGAKQYCEEIVKKWPDTEAAKEAKKLLEKLKK